MDATESSLLRPTTMPLICAVVPSGGLGGVSGATFASGSTAWTPSPAPSAAALRPDPETSSVPSTPWTRQQAAPPAHAPKRSRFASISHSSRSGQLKFRVARDHLRVGEAAVLRIPDLAVPAFVALGAEPRVPERRLGLSVALAVAPVFVFGAAFVSAAARRLQ